MNLLNILKQYNIEEFSNPKLIKESADNIVYLIDSKDKKILRISKRLPIEDVEFEFKAFEYLSKNKFPVPKWNKTKDDKVFAEFENTVAVMFDFIDGYQAKADKDNLPNKDQTYIAGKYLALMHNIGVSFKTNLSRKRDIFTEMERVINGKNIFIEQFENGKEFTEQVKEAIKFGKEDKNIKSLIHNDYRPSNVLFKNDNKINGIIDFDWSCNGPVIKDLALATVEWSFSDNQAEPEWELFDTFLSGYNSVAKNKCEKGALLYSWIKFACLSDACTFFADANEGQYSDKVINDTDQCYMYKKFKYFNNLIK